MRRPIRYGSHRSSVLIITRDTDMLDAVYVAGTVLFFGLMLAYVRACDAIGRDKSGRENAD